MEMRIADCVERVLHGYRSRGRPKAKVKESTIRVGRSVMWLSSTSFRRFVTRAHSAADGGDRYSAKLPARHVGPLPGRPGPRDLAEAISDTDAV